MQVLACPEQTSPLHGTPSHASPASPGPAVSAASSPVQHGRGIRHEAARLPLEPLMEPRLQERPSWPDATAAERHADSVSAQEEGAEASQQGTDSVGAEEDGGAVQDDEGASVGLDAEHSDSSRGELAQPGECSSSGAAEAGGCAWARGSAGGGHNPVQQQELREHPQAWHQVLRDSGEHSEACQPPATPLTALAQPDGAPGCDPSPRDPPITSTPGGGFKPPSLSAAWQVALAAGSQGSATGQACPTPSPCATPPQAGTPQPQRTSGLLAPAGTPNAAAVAVWAAAGAGAAVASPIGGALAYRSQAALAAAAARHFNLLSLEREDSIRSVCTATTASGACSPMQSPQHPARLAGQLAVVAGLLGRMHARSPLHRSRSGRLGRGSGDSLTDDEELLSPPRRRSCPPGDMAGEGPHVAASFAFTSLAPRAATTTAADTGPSGGAPATPGQMGVSAGGALAGAGLRTGAFADATLMPGPATGPGPGGFSPVTGPHASTVHSPHRADCSSTGSQPVSDAAVLSHGSPGQHRHAPSPGQGCGGVQQHLQSPSHAGAWAVVSTGGMPPSPSVQNQWGGDGGPHRCSPGKPGAGFMPAGAGAHAQQHRHQRAASEGLSQAGQPAIPPSGAQPAAALAAAGGPSPSAALALPRRALFAPPGASPSHHYVSAESSQANTPQTVFVARSPQQSGAGTPARGWPLSCTSSPQPSDTPSPARPMAPPALNGWPLSTHASPRQQSCPGAQHPRSPHVHRQQGHATPGSPPPPQHQSPTSSQS